MTDEPADNKTDGVSDEPASVRRGSPFQGTPVVPAQVIDGSRSRLAAAVPEITADIGPAKMTAIGAILASATVAVFGVGCAVWFPGGGTVVCMLGCALAVLGLSSARIKSAIAVLLVNLTLFGFCFVQATGG